MKIILKGNEPDELLEYKSIYPDDDWKNGFTRNAGAEANRKVKHALITDQGGICVYCEIDLKDAGGRALNDFRVEHFYPENPEPGERRNDNINYALFWPNLLGCCTGGNARYVVDAHRRYTNPVFCCDVDKSNHDWTQLILNPIDDIPAFPALFSFDFANGNIMVSELCPAELRSKAEQSIDLLKLNTPKLQEFRVEVITILTEQLFPDGDTAINDVEIQQRMQTLAHAYLIRDTNNMLQPFFTTVRAFLGTAAETVLMQYNFKG
ncbi:retron Ec78 anti-phage system effector HNH endonuclease PtuB [Klebsiella variicola]|uniref:retron Ec78 anti-phage system effector HNH endonuclease PtuB n=1 Tax=Klebsiella variicola TaxID=244366 RepID=UPI001034CD62|nr:retron Ec78 anti-phage system effector HNH endonuclease PtuB [Klebsiella variicola]MEB6444351.1 TIGR02646 family protein [Klebsiella variicola]VFZ00266.1 Uncharacterised protein [Klebsiella variicola]VGA37587.1 Uncharacterised protein [Klebsiella variicola]